MLRPGYRPTLRSSGGRGDAVRRRGIGRPRHVWWNLVSSSRERIDETKRAWKAGEFPVPPGDDDEWIPLPEVPLTVSYP